MERAVVLFSGGLDSTTLLYSVARECEVLAFSLHYGQKHVRELDAAEEVFDNFLVSGTYYGKPKHEVVDLPQLRALLGGSSQTDDNIPVPKGHYTDESMRVTVVPNRNMILLAIAAGWGVSQRAKYVFYAAHSGDHAIYADCCPDFVDAMASSLIEATLPKPILLSTPFLEKTKAEIVALGAQLHVPFELTWSCYEGGEKHCGTCGTCTERREAFKLAGVEDPTKYA